MVHSDIARDLAVRPDTVRNYLSYLDIVFLTTTVLAWSGSLASKITKTPKVFVTDSGLAAHLLRVTADGLRAPGHPALGGLVETFVLSELVKLQASSETRTRIHRARVTERRVGPGEPPRSVRDDGMLIFRPRRMLGHPVPPAS
jgi:predicted AAA+ superfamily ATPase